ncbi:MAG: hypothetical protein ABH837_03930 [bacterium]
MNENQKEHFEKLKKTLTQEEISLVHKLITERTVFQKYLEKFPLLLGVLGAFGLVALFYSFEKLMDKTVLVEYPWFLLVMALIILYITGASLKKL